MNTAQMIATNVLGGGVSRADQYAAYINSLSLPVWIKFQETSGNPVNSGSLALTLTNSSAAAPTQAQNGAPQGAIARANEANDFAGETSNGAVVTITNNATLKAWTTQRWAVLCHPDTLGGSSSGKMLVWGGFGATDHLILGMVSSNRIQSTINTDTTNGAAISNVNQISDCIGAWCWFFMDYDDANALGNGRKIRIFKGLNGVVTQLTLATDTAATGTVDQPATGLAIGNTTARTVTFDGQIDEVLGSPALWSTTEMQNIVNLFL